MGAGVGAGDGAGVGLGVGAFMHAAKTSSADMATRVNAFLTGWNLIRFIIFSFLPYTILGYCTMTVPFISL